MKKKKKPADAQHSEECAVRFGLGCTCPAGEPVHMKAQRLHLEEKWRRYRREVLVPSGIDKHPALEDHMQRAFMVGVASTLSLLFKERMPVSIATDIENELDQWGEA